MIINDEHKYVFVAVPKTGTTSIHFALEPGVQHPAPAEHHAGVRKLLADHPRIEPYFKFAFVRNPWSKLWSLYADFTMRRVKQYSQFVAHDEPLLSEFKDFEDMCLNLHDSPWFQDIFFRPQIELVTKEDGSQVDFVGRYENLDTDFGHLISLSTIPVINPLSVRNRGHYSGSYRDHYTPAAVEAVAKLYAEDIEAFGYAF